jgi:inositol phosphorylceramide synthase catalytic subunit
MPSLQVTYPLLILLEGWRNFRPLLRALSVMFFASMVFAAVYLDHHWVLDVIAGITYCLVAHAALRVLFAWRVRTEKVRGGAGVTREQPEPAALARS